MANEPITREEMLLSAVATGEATNLKPITREEMFLAKLGGADVNAPTPITRKEQFCRKRLKALALAAALVVMRRVEPALLWR